MFSSAIDPYDAPLAWWEVDCVKYALSYTPVKSHLMTVMGSHIVRLTDRKYMMQFVSRLQEEYEMQQKVRIERKKLRPTLIIPELYILRESLKAIPRKRRQCVPKYAKMRISAAKKCKQLPRLLLENNSEICKDS